MQPGIEALNSESLRLMRKGSKAVTNVNLLRWCEYYGLDVKWNRIVGFPGETVQAIDEEVDLVRSLWHLAPPGNAGGISLDRYSPLFEDPTRFPPKNLRPSPGFAAVYPPTVDPSRASVQLRGRPRRHAELRHVRPALRSRTALGEPARRVLHPD